MKKFANDINRVSCMLIKQQTKEKIQQAINNGKIFDVFHKAKADEIEKKAGNAGFLIEEKICPLADSNGDIIRLKPFEMIDKCIEEKKLPVSLKDAYNYTAQKRIGGELYLTTALLIYPQENGKNKSEIFYKEKGKEYVCRIPKEAGGLKENEALFLFFNFFEDGTPYFQRIESKFKGRPIEEIVINKPHELVAKKALTAVPARAEYGAYYVRPEKVFGKLEVNDSSPDIWVIYGTQKTPCMCFMKIGWGYKNAVNIFIETGSLDAKSIMLVYK
jgi:hypothetical protein